MIKAGEILADDDGVHLDPIFSMPNFEVYIGGWPNALWDGQLGYLLYNKRTNVCEGVFGTEAMSIRACREMETELAQTLSGEGPVTTSDDQAFQEMMKRLAERGDIN